VCRECLFVRNPLDDSGHREDDMFLNAPAEGLGEDHPLKELILASLNGPTFWGLESILSTCRNLESFAATFVTLNQEGATSLANGISPSTSLKQVMLHACNIRSSGTSQVIKAVADSPTIESLAL